MIHFDTIGTKGGRERENAIKGQNGRITDEENELSWQKGKREVGNESENE